VCGEGGSDHDDHSDDEGGGAEGDGASGQKVQAAEQAAGGSSKGKGSRNANNVWTTDSLITFLRTVTAHNPFQKDTMQSIDNKWNMIAAAMSASTHHLREHHIVATAKTLRAKFTRLRRDLRTHATQSKASKVSGQAAVIKDQDLTKLAAEMEHCNILIRDASAFKTSKREHADAQKAFRSNIVEPAFLEMASGKQRRKVLTLLQAEDRKMRQEQQLFPSTNAGKVWQPTPLQERNMALWVQAKAKWPDEAKETEGKPSRRKALEPSAIERLILQFIASQPPPAQPTQNQQYASSTPARIAQLNQLLADGLLTEQLHAQLVTKALGL